MDFAVGPLAYGGAVARSTIVSAGRRGRRQRTSAPTKVVGGHANMATGITFAAGDATAGSVSI